MDQIIPMTALNARRVRILKESEEKLAQHVKSRDNTTILEFLDNVNDNDRASLFQSAVLKLTCNNDADTLGAVLDYGKEKTLDVQWTEDDKGKEKKLDVQWTEVDEGKKKSQDFEEWLKEEGRRNPIMVASEQASFSSYTFYTFMTEFIIANDFVGLPSVHKTALQVWLPDSQHPNIRHCSAGRTRKVSVKAGDKEPRGG